MPRRRTDPEPLAGSPIRVALVSARPIFALGLRETLLRTPDVVLATSLRSVRRAIEVLGRRSADVVLVDLAAAGPGDNAIRRVHQAAPECAIVAIGREHDDASIVEAIQAGAAAHLDDQAEPGELLRVIRHVARGHRPIREELAGRADLIDRLVEAVAESFGTERGPTYPLTPRETDILRLVARGLRNREIAESVGVSEQTVKNHLTTVMHKLGVRGRSQAVAYARRQGWLPTADDAAEIPERPMEASRS